MESKAIRKRAQAVLPGGVNSPVRAFSAVGGNAPYIDHAQGAYLFDVEGKRYIDYVGSWGPMILGHAQAEVIAAVKAAADRGLSFGASTLAEVELAELIIKRFSSIEMLRCVSSGTEATMSALRAARGFTGRSLIVKFDGNYHGHSDCLLVQAGSGAATFGSPDSAGVPKEVVQNTLSARYNDIHALRELFAQRGQEIAAVIVEPVAGNMGCVAPQPGFLEAIVELCTTHGAISIFDEVMTGCRLSSAGAQGRYGLKPNMTCLGKIVGGGMPLAVYGGRREIMEQIAPLGPVYQAGTLSGNPLSVAAAIATLNQLNETVYAQLEARGQELEEGLNQQIRDLHVEACVQRVGSMITIFFHSGPIVSWDDAKNCNRERFARFHQVLTQQGVYFPPAQFEAAFISYAHTENDIKQTLLATHKAFSACR